MPSEKYKRLRAWSDLHLEAVKAALGRQFMTVSNFNDDVKRGIDLYMPEYNFAVRIRKSGYKSYQDFTLRTSYGGECSEYAKMLRPGAPEFMFYGYADSSTAVSPGYLIDLKQWRISMQLGEVKPKFKRNSDGSHFVAFPFHDSYSRQIS